MNKEDWRFGGQRRWRGKLVQYPDHEACVWRPPGAEGRHRSPGAGAGWEKRGDMGTEGQSGTSGHTQNLHTQW